MSIALSPALSRRHSAPARRLDLRRLLTGAISLLAVLVAPFLFDGTAHALQCGRRLVTTGDRAHYVRSVCGEPSSVSTRAVTRSQSAAARIGPHSIIGEGVTVTVLVETWVYDFGPRRLMAELVLEDGVVVATRTLGYGTVRGAAAREAPEAPSPEARTTDIPPGDRIRPATH
jgi:hypothetical protein